MSAGLMKLIPPTKTFDHVEPPKRDTRLLCPGWPKGPCGLAAGTPYTDTYCTFCDGKRREHIENAINAGSILVPSAAEDTPAVQNGIGGGEADEQGYCGYNGVYLRPNWTPGDVTQAKQRTHALMYGGSATGRWDSSRYVKGRALSLEDYSRAGRRWITLEEFAKQTMSWEQAGHVMVQFHDEISVIDPEEFKRIFEQRGKSPYNCGSYVIGDRCIINIDDPKRYAPGENEVVEAEDTADEDYEESPHYDQPDQNDE